MSNDFEFLSAIDGIDSAMVADTGPQYPVIQWNSGNRSMKKLGVDSMDYSGGFFMKLDAIDEATMAAAGWTKTSWTHGDGSEEAGWYRRQIEVAVIATRKRWEVYEQGNRRPKVFPWMQYEKAAEFGRPKGKTHALCLVKGLEVAGPILLTWSGMAAKAFEGNRSTLGAVSKFQQTVITAGNNALAAAGKRGKGWPLFAFWLPVGANRDAKNEPIFTEVGTGNSTSHIVLPVALSLPEKPADVDIKKYFVGAALLESAKGIWRENESWASAWDNLTNEPDEEEALGTTPTVEEKAIIDSDQLAALGV